MVLLFPEGKKQEREQWMLFPKLKLFLSIDSGSFSF